MISIIAPTLNAQDALPATLQALFPGIVGGLIKELIVVDGGSDDLTAKMAQEAGARVFTGKRGRGRQLQLGAEKAKADWLLFLHADTVLDENWHREVQSFIAGHDGQKAGVFSFKLNDNRTRARVLETIVWLRCRLLALPYGDQGLLISRQLYDEIGGFEPLVLMEDVAIVRKIGRSRIHYFRTIATTSAARYQKDGYVKRVLKNARCLTLWFLGVAPEKILDKYK